MDESIEIASLFSEDEEQDECFIGAADRTESDLTITEIEDILRANDVGLVKQLLNTVRENATELQIRFSICAMVSDKFDVFNYIISTHLSQGHDRLLHTFADSVRKTRQYEKYYIAMFNMFYSKYKPHTFGDHFWIHVAAEINDHTLRWVLSRGLNLNARNWEGETLLHYAVKYGQVYLAKKFLKMGVDPNLACYNHYTPFMVSLLFEQDKISKLLLEHETCENVASCGTALMIALIKGSPMAYRLILNSANVNYNMGKKYNCLDLFFTSSRRSLKIFKAIWSRFDYEKIYSRKESTVIERILTTSWRGKYPFLLTIIQSDKLQDVVNHGRLKRRFYRNTLPERVFWLDSYTSLNSGAFVIGYLVATLNDEGISLRNIEKLVIRLLESGVPLVHSDLEILLVIFKHGSFIERVLEFPVIYAGPFTVTNNALAHHVVHVGNSAYWVTNKVKCVADEKKFLRKYFIVDDQIPALVELARNACRRVICLHYSLKSVWEFYRTLFMLELPKFIVDILMLRCPLYYLEM